MSRIIPDQVEGVRAAEEADSAGRRVFPSGRWQHVLPRKRAAEELSWGVLDARTIDADRAAGVLADSVAAEWRLRLGWAVGEIGCDLKFKSLLKNVSFDV